VGDPSQNGLLVFLSPNLLNSVTSALEDSTCTAGLSTACYQAVINILEGPEVVLERRDLMPSPENGLEKRQVLLAGAAIVGIASMIYESVHLGTGKVPQPLVIPVPEIEQAIALETATAIVVVQSAATATSRCSGRFLSSFRMSRDSLLRHYPISPGTFHIEQLLTPPLS
jgi:hypothetical protein